MANGRLTNHLGPTFVWFMIELTKTIEDLDVSGDDTFLGKDLENLNFLNAMQAWKEKSTTNSREYSFWAEAELLSYQPPDAPTDDETYAAVAKAWRNVTAAGNSYPSIGRIGMSPSHSFQHALDIIKSVYRDFISSSLRWTSYTRNVRAFIYHVGCPQAHDEPERNLAELRLFHSTQMPFFAKLQEDLQEQIRMNNRQQEVITALAFRHLLEHLPDPSTYQGTATAKWKNFWKHMVIGESNKKKGSGHPLEGLIGQGVVSHGTIAKDTDNQKYQTYVDGLRLFGTLSADIHGYKGAFKVRDDQWGKVNRDVLRALIPQSFDADGGVDWAAERKRYL